jgi:hypothetical protein
MSIVENKVQFDPRLKRRKALLLLLTGIEFTLTFVLSLMLVVSRWLAPASDAAVGVPNKLSYQGRLTDTSGNALGGSGTNYCFRFSLYDSALGGSKIWPSATPTSSTLSVVSGVFNATIGEADTLDYNFYATDTVYLNVEVNTSTSTCHAANFETMTPRQQVLATGFAITSQNVYGSLLKTDISASSVQVGSGAGSSAPKFLTLDVQNTAVVLGSSCSVNGQLWYNSNASNTQALVCENSVVRPVTDQFPLAMYPTIPLPLAVSTNNSGTTAAGTNITQSFHVSPLVLEHAVVFTRVNILVSNVTIAGTGSGSVNRNVGIYTLNSGTALSLLSSFFFRHDVSQSSVTAQSHRFYWGTNSTSNSSSSGGNISANYAGVRAIPVYTGSTSLSAGKYYLVYGQLNQTAGSNIMTGYGNMYVSFSQTTAGQLGSAASISPFPLLGQFSSTSTFGNLTSPFMPASIHTSVITNTGGTSQWKSNYIHLIGRPL